MDNEAIFLTAPGKLQLRPAAMPVPGPDEVLVKMEYCGICGSDVGYFRNGRIVSRKVVFPYILGHECAGEVIQTGADVAALSAGDKVVLEPGLGCGHCEYCVSGRYNLCPDIKFMATPPYPGAFQRYLSYPARGCFALPEQISTLEAAMIEPLAVGLHAAKRGEVNNEKTVFIIGAGCIGLMTLLACKARGAQKIIISDILQNRLDKALQLGADYAIYSGETDVKTRVMELTGGRGADVVIETAGRPETAAQTVGFLNRGGIVVQVGTVAEPVSYYLNELGHLEGEIRSVFRYCNMFPLAIRLIEKGAIALKAIGPSVFDFEDAAEAFDTAIRQGDRVVKCVLKF